MGTVVDFRGGLSHIYGVGKGARTLNHLIHSQVLCQLSYAHHARLTARFPERADYIRVQLA
jgi:hypothetical protein